MIILLCLTIFSGALLSIQAAINARLSQTVGILSTTFLTFALGALITFLLAIFLESNHTQHLLSVPKWQLMGAFLGVPYILIMTFAVPRVGVAIATVAVILGQLLMSLMIDQYGWFNNPIITFSWHHALASFFLFIALIFIYKSNKIHNVMSN